jgi:hypothetical protein
MVLRSPDASCTANATIGAPVFVVVAATFCPNRFGSMPSGAVMARKPCGALESLELDELELELLELFVVVVVVSAFLLLPPHAISKVAPMQSAAIREVVVRIRAQ